MRARGLRLALGLVSTFALLAPGLARSRDVSGEAALLAQERRDYEALKSRRDQLLAELSRSWPELDAPPDPELDQPSKLALRSTREMSIREKEAILVETLRRTHELRRSIAERELSLAGGGEEAAALPSGLEGSYVLAFEGVDGEGSLRMVQTGAFLSGAYAVGKVSRGTFIGNGGSGKVVLTLIDEGGDLFAVLSGIYPSKTHLQGTYLRGDLASGSPSQGSWSARRTRER